MLSNVEGWGISKCSRLLILVFLSNWICTTTRHANKILLAKNLPFNSDSETILQWYHCIVYGLNWTIERVFNLNMIWRSFCYSCLISLVQLLFHSLFTFSSYAKIQVDCKMNTKKNFLQKTFGDIFGQLHTQECKATKK